MISVIRNLGKCKLKTRCTRCVSNKIDLFRQAEESQQVSSLNLCTTIMTFHCSDNNNNNIFFIINCIYKYRCVQIINDNTLPYIIRLCICVYVVIVQRERYKIRAHQHTSNGIKQGGVLSPLLFTVYLDQLILALKESGIGCHLNGMFVGTFIYADDVTLLAPTSMALKAMLSTCTDFAASHNCFLMHQKLNVCILMMLAHNCRTPLSSWVDQLNM